LELLQSAGALATTSANLSGGENTVTAQEVYDQLAGKVDLIIDGGTCPGEFLPQLWIAPAQHYAFFARVPYQKTN